MEFQDRPIQCIDCKNDFIFTAGEQEFYERKGFKEVPKRCKPCREARKTAFYGADWWVENEAFAMGHVIEYDVTFLETVKHRVGGRFETAPWPLTGERPGSRGDGPPDGWTASTRRTFVREAQPG